MMNMLMKSPLCAKSRRYKAYFDPEFLKNYTCCSGFWFFGAGNFFSEIFFDLSDVRNYPFLFTHYMREHIRRLLDQVKIEIKGNHKFFNISDPCAADNVFFIYSYIRNWAKQWCKDFGQTQLNYMHCSCNRLPDNTDISPEILKKQLNFLCIAKRIVANEISVEEAAQFYKINPVNIRIWVSIYLTHGQRAFLNGRDLLFSKQNQEDIWESHINNGYNTVKTCTQYLLYNRNRLKHIRHRFHNP